MSSDTTVTSKMCLRQPGTRGVVAGHCGVWAVNMRIRKIKCLGKRFNILKVAVGQSGARPHGGIT